MASNTPTTIACCKRSDSGVQREVREREKKGERDGGREEGTLAPYPSPPPPPPLLFSCSHPVCVATRDKALEAFPIEIYIACVATVRSPNNLNTCNRSPSAGIMQNSANYLFQPMVALLRGCKPVHKM